MDAREAEERRDQGEALAETLERAAAAAERLPTVRELEELTGALRTAVEEAEKLPTLDYRVGTIPARTAVNQVIQEFEAMREGETLSSIEDLHAWHALNLSPWVLRDVAALRDAASRQAIEYEEKGQDQGDAPPDSPIQQWHRLADYLSGDPY